MAMGSWELLASGIALPRCLRILVANKLIQGPLREEQINRWQWIGRRWLGSPVRGPLLHGSLGQLALGTGF